MDSYSHRIIESLRLEKTSKIIKSNCQPNTTTSAKPCPEVPHVHIFLTPPGMMTPPDLNFTKRMLLDIQAWIWDV